MLDLAKLNAELRAGSVGVVAPAVAVCVIDFETYSECDLKLCGSRVYAQHPSTEILCMSYRTPRMGKAKIWVPSRDPFPQEVIDHILDGGALEAHNAGFERNIWKYVLMAGKNLPPNPDMPWSEIPWPRKWKDSLAVCAYRALPLDLGDVGSVLRLTTQKDRRGKDLLRILSKPQKPTKKRPERRRRDPDLLEELYAYCCRDTDTEWELAERIGDLPTPEYRLWVLDQKINDRGVYVNVKSVQAALDIVAKVHVKLERELLKLTDGMVSTVNERDNLILWLTGNGCPVDDMTADTVKRLLSPERTLKLDPKVKRVLEIRQTLARASTKKLIKFLSCVSPVSGRIHGLLQYHGASTGRWAGRLVQPQNFPRGDEAILKQGVELLIEIIQYADPELVQVIYGDPMNAIATALRCMIEAEPGNTYYVADFSAIEARVTSWLFGEQWKLDAFIEVDQGRGYKGSDDIYCAAAAMVFGHPVKKKEAPEKRQVGKMCELAFGYQGGVGAWRNFDPREPGDKGYVEDEKVNGYKVGWRVAHPNIVSGWWGLEGAAIECVQTGRPVYYSKVTYEIVNDAAGKWLACVLPNGRRIWYFNPEVTGYTDHYGRAKYTLSYEGKDNKVGGRWSRIETYGGMLTENIVQAISRDLMVEAMIRVEAAGYPIVLTVHDEIVSETKNNFGSLEEFLRLMKIVPVWAEGCPIHAAGWTGTVYHKE